MIIERLRNIAKEQLPSYKKSSWCPYYQKLNFKLMEMKDSRIKMATGQLEQNDPIIVYSVGARYGLPSPFADYLRAKKLLIGIGFEPDYKEAQRLKDNDLFDLVFPYALGSQCEKC